MLEPGWLMRSLAMTSVSYLMLPDAFMEQAGTTFESSLPRAVEAANQYPEAMNALVNLAREHERKARLIRKALKEHKNGTK